MNVTASKVLLGVSLVAYTWCSWDRLFETTKKVAPTPKGKEVTAAMIHHVAPLELAGDPFASVPLDRGTPREPVKAQGIAGVLPDDPSRPLGELKLHGTFMTPTGRVALVNGRPVGEGEIIELEPNKARIRARRIGEDFAVIEGGGRLITLRLIEEKTRNTASASTTSGHE